jgi:hypothetical protein
MDANPDRPIKLSRTLDSLVAAASDRIEDKLELGSDLKPKFSQSRAYAPLDSRTQRR